MSLLLAWIVFPLVLAAVALGCGLLIARAIGRTLPGVLLIPVGFALLVVSATLTTMSAATARLTTPLVVVLALAGYALSRRRRPRLDAWAVAAALAVFAIYAAPIVLSGSATFAGYLTLDDTSTWLALADNALQHGRSSASLPASTYSVVVHDYMSTGYPLGAFLPLGIGHQLTGQDEAWIFQAQIAFLASLLALSIYSFTAPLLHARSLRAAVAFIGAQPALLYGYAFWSGIKEMTTAALVAVLAALVASNINGRWRFRDLPAVAVVAAAILDVETVVGTVWLAAAGVLAIALIARSGLKRGPALALALGAATALLATPAFAVVQVFVHVASSGGGVASSGTLGNLLHPLNPLQLFGIWPVADFRLRPADMDLTYGLIVALALSACAGVAVAARRRAWGVPLYLGATLAGCFSVFAFSKVGHGSPWLNGKAFASASPALLVAGAAGAAMLFEHRRHVESVLAAAAIVGGVLWSNALTYSNVWLAPRAQMSELAAIGQRFAGDGPTLLTEYQPYGVKHFLRSMAPEGAAERRSRPVYLRNGSVLNKLQYADLDAFQLSSILVYRTIVLRTSPLESRPPSLYHLVWQGPWYEVWQRPALPQATIIEHLPLGDAAQPINPLGDEQQVASAATCSQVRKLATLAAQQHGSIVAAEQMPAITVDLDTTAHPPSWQTNTNGSILPTGAGSAEVTVRVPRAGSYGFWLGGSFRDHLAIEADNHPVGALTGALNETGQLTPFGSARLSAGANRIVISDGGPGLLPGSGSYQFAFGPLEIGRSAAQSRLLRVTPANANSLCGRKLAWIEAVRHSGAGT